MKKTVCGVCASSLIVALSMPAQAERADREKPIHLEADRMSIDDVKKVKILEGNAVLIQGTMELRTSRLVVTEDADGFQKASAIGGANGLAHFRQKREGRDDFTEGEAERIDHDARSEITEFFIRAWVQSGLDEVKGQYISYDALNEKYLATTGGGTKSATGVGQARVRAIIQPKSKDEKPAEKPAEKKGEPLTLKPAPKVNPRLD
ncbi:MAG: lipopolysaccharide transport periplasmic protein LptA [Candidatus Accumulibacter sp.]|jgi:lipopolysaccharide export system protein LptA|uniref:lipopolysaccharide transport periplasmic protein LptA n=1 Tax=Candidatus Accumulibacter TaxID=327159 RepID=UPI001AD2BD11|nr:lipopolysaccharide transport periplasmic protein LptA [Accumulibacter sp.]MBK8115975.1 lipopolysaccharide transport periplasmic protein LptA [Accumulibacter sp.]MBK8385916.1 lipopolysaccharide transport periplasmic protein LptA [Accumulibacter sp.]MBK8580160.1 lipopolysaccharide transport periplasmic protein LptA [Candidatus Accumulibacter propinquus]MBN8438060.1 lipopolysaccharide transport periplasmic protein LptA [Accumulibacter sp.]